VTNIYIEVIYLSGEVNHKEKLEPNEEMVQDLVSIITCFSAKIYGARGGKK
jgi:predicted site-specific integrase-resolvase